MTNDQSRDSQRVGIIPLDGRPHPSRNVAFDMGDARGHWEGDTLVVETTNFTARSVYRNANPAMLKLAERFRRIARDHDRHPAAATGPDSQ